jgi:hypothetical protein
MAGWRPRGNDPHPLRRPLQALSDPRLRGIAAAAHRPRARRPSYVRTPPRPHSGRGGRARCGPASPRDDPGDDHPAQGDLPPRSPPRATGRQIPPPGSSCQPCAGTRPDSRSGRGGGAPDRLPEADRAIWATAMYAGLRRGELMALRAESIDLDANVIHVERGGDAKGGDRDEGSQPAPRPDPCGVARVSSRSPAPYGAP